MEVDSENIDVEHMEDEPRVEYEVDEDELSCPKGYPLEDWMTLSIGNKRAYLKAIKNTKKLIGG